MNHVNHGCFFPKRVLTCLNQKIWKKLISLILLLIASLKTKIHIKFLLIFNCTFSLILALEKDFKKLRSFIETKKASPFVAADKGDLVFCKLLLCDGFILKVLIPGNKLLYMRLLVEDIDIDILWSIFHGATFNIFWIVCH